MSKEIRHLQKLAKSNDEVVVSTIAVIEFFLNLKARVIFFCIHLKSFAVML